MCGRSGNVLSVPLPRLMGIFNSCVLRLMVGRPKGRCILVLINFERFRPHNKYLVLLFIKKRSLMHAKRLYFSKRLKRT